MPNYFICAFSRFSYKMFQLIQRLRHLRLPNSLQDFYHKLQDHLNNQTLEPKRDNRHDYIPFHSSGDQDRLWETQFEQLDVWCWRVDWTLAWFRSCPGLCVWYIGTFLLFCENRIFADAFYFRPSSYCWPPQIIFGDGKMEKQPLVTDSEDACSWLLVAPPCDWTQLYKRRHLR